MQPYRIDLGIVSTTTFAHFTAVACLYVLEPCLLPTPADENRLSGPAQTTGNEFVPFSRAISAFLFVQACPSSEITAEREAVPPAPPPVTPLV